VEDILASFRKESRPDRRLEGVEVWGWVVLASTD
jgi:hypothetical protein